MNNAGQTRAGSKTAGIIPSFRCLLRWRRKGVSGSRHEGHGGQPPNRPRKTRFILNTVGISPNGTDDNIVSRCSKGPGFSPPPLADISPPALSLPRQPLHPDAPCLKLGHSFAADPRFMFHASWERRVNDTASFFSILLDDRLWMTDRQRTTPCLVFLSWGLTCAFHGTTARVGDGTLPSHRSFITINMKRRERKGHSGAGHWRSHPQCPQKMCMACG